MINRVKKIIIIAALAIGGLGAPLAAASNAFAAPIDAQAQACAGTGGKIVKGECTGNSTNADLGALIKNIVNVLLYVIGAVAVIVIIIGGIRYTTSSGDASRVKTAKDSILYAVVGLVIAILAYAIVNFVIKNV